MTALPANPPAPVRPLRTYDLISWDIPYFEYRAHADGTVRSFLAFQRDVAAVSALLRRRGIPHRVARAGAEGDGVAAYLRFHVGAVA